MLPHSIRAIGNEKYGSGDPPTTQVYVFSNLIRVLMKHSFNNDVHMDSKFFKEYNLILMHGI